MSDEPMEAGGPDEPAAILISTQDIWLIPKISADTMSLNGGVAFGSALAGGALAGPMGAFMALPATALITSFISNYAAHHEVVYQSPFADDEPPTAEDVTK